MFKIFKRNKNRNSEYNMEVLNTTQPKRRNVRDDGSMMTPVEMKANKIMNRVSSDMTDVQKEQWIKDMMLVEKELSLTATIPVEAKKKMMADLKATIRNANLEAVVKATEEAVRSNETVVDMTIKKSNVAKKENKQGKRISMIANKNGRFGISVTKTGVVESSIDRELVINDSDLQLVSNNGQVSIYNKPMEDRDSINIFGIVKIEKRVSYAITNDKTFVSESIRRDITTNITTLLAIANAAVLAKNAIKELGFKKALKTFANKQAKKYIPALNK